MVIARRLMHSWHSLDICSRLQMLFGLPTFCNLSSRSRQGEFQSNTHSRLQATARGYGCRCFSINHLLSFNTSNSLLFTHILVPEIVITKTPVNPSLGVVTITASPSKYSSAFTKSPRFIYHLDLLLLEPRVVLWCCPDDTKIVWWVRERHECPVVFDYHTSPTVMRLARMLEFYQITYFHWSPRSRPSGANLTRANQESRAQSSRDLRWYHWRSWFFSAIVWLQSLTFLGYGCGSWCALMRCWEPWNVLCRRCS